jgi:cytochrome d ubiquinol oxidase subunit II
MALQLTWFILWSILWALYFMLDGFVLGTGMLSGVLGKSDTEKRMLINSVGPVWSGNEVWLITIGGVTFATFPIVYALMFSYLYTALLLLLFALIIRGVSFEFRGKIDHLSWKSAWDIAIIVSSFLPALLFGVIFGNIFQGLPMDSSGYHGSLFMLFNPYGLMTGILFVLLFAIHGALYASVKTSGELSSRARSIANNLWPLLLVVTITFLGYTKYATKLFNNYFNHPILAIFPLIFMMSVIAVKIFIVKEALLKAFAFSCIAIAFVIFSGLAGMFPSLIPSSIDSAYNLTVFNSSSSPYALKIMTAAAMIFIPIVILYQIWVYRVFRARVNSDDIVSGYEGY